MKIKIINKSKNSLPEYATSGSAGMDLRADLEHINLKFLFNCQYFIDETHPEGVLKINPGGRALIPTGLSIELPEGYEAQIRPRSGTALKYGLTVLNTPGTIDSDYRGDIGVILANFSDEVQIINPSERIAQMVIAKYERAEWEETTELSDTLRGSGGFNSTGKN